MRFKLLTALLGMLMCASLAQGSPFAYITNLSDNTVSVVDTQTDSFVAKVPLGAGVQPYGVAISRDGSLVYTTNQISKNISVIDALTDPYNPTVINTIGPLPFTPSGLAIYSVGSLKYLYVAYKDANKVAVIDVSGPMAPNTTVAPNVIREHTVENSPTGVTIHPDGLAVYVTNFGSNSVSIIATSSPYNVINTPLLEAESYPLGVAAGKVANVTKIFTANYNKNTVSVIDAISQTVTNTISVGANPYAVAVAPDGNTIYVSNSGETTTNHISVIPTTGPGAYQVASSYPMPGTVPQSIAVSPDGFTLYAVNSIGGNIEGTLTFINLNNGYSTELYNANHFFNSPQSMGNFIGPQLLHITAIAGANGTISPAGTRYFAAGASQAYQMIPISSDYRVNRVTVNGSAINLDTDPRYSKTSNTFTFSNIQMENQIEVTFIKDYDYVSIDRSGTGTGKVISSPAGINCSASTSPSLCSAPFDEDVEVTITAYPDPGFYFSRWVGDIYWVNSQQYVLINNGALCDGKTTETCTFPMSTYAHFTAEFTSAPPNVQMVMLNGDKVFYPSLQAAFTAATSATVEIRLAMDNFNTSAISNLNTNGAIFKLSGGWPSDRSFLNPVTTTPTEIKGSLTITKGQIIADNIAIK